MKSDISVIMSFCLKTLETLNFRNHTQVTVNFNKRLNFIVGENASGKTTLLNAIYYLSFTKGFMGYYDQDNVRSGTDFFMIKGEYSLNGSDETLFCGLKKEGKKQFMRNGNEYERFYEHIGVFPLVIVSPYDSELILAGSEERRRFTDSIISQIDRPYLEVLLGYSRILKQRNALLKNIIDTGRNDDETLEIYNSQLSEMGKSIYQKRRTFIAAFKPLFSKIYKHLSSANETVDIEYESHLHESDFETLLASTRQRDLASGHTSVGVHRDDLKFSINNLTAKQAGSQGQQKTFLLALRLAQYAYIKEIVKTPPLLLLDDIFDKLDDKRVALLLEEVLKPQYGQIFITHTNLYILEWVLGNVKTDYTVIKLKEGGLDEQQ